MYSTFDFCTSSVSASGLVYFVNTEQCMRKRKLQSDKHLKRQLRSTGSSKICSLMINSYYTSSTLTSANFAPLFICFCTYPAYVSSYFAPYSQSYSK